MSSLVNVFRFISDHPLTREHRVKAFGRVAGCQMKSRFHREVCRLVDRKPKARS
jgi:hypothetical protein